MAAPKKNHAADKARELAQRASVQPVQMPLPSQSAKTPDPILAESAASGAIDSARARDAAVFRHHDGERAESRLLAIEARPKILKELVKIALEDKSGKLRIMAGQVVLAVAERVTPLAVAVAQAGAVGSALPPGAQLVAGESVSTSTTRAGTKTDTVTTQVGILAPDFRF